MKDIQSRIDIEHLIDTFYKQVVSDDLIGSFFTEVVKLDWNVHMPIMYDFWESTLFGKASYKGNPMLVHMRLNEKQPLTEAHFERWLSLWEETVHAHFEGKRAEEAVSKARQIAQLMQYKIKNNPLTL